LNLLHRASHAIGSPGALLLLTAVLASGAVWSFNEGWWLWIDRLIYIGTFYAALIVQWAQNRDTEAMQAKLDELIRAIDKADDRLRGIENE
jgi:low affinity Fe/Cu permease